MTSYELSGLDIRLKIKKLILNYMYNTSRCYYGKSGVTQAIMFDIFDFEYVFQNDVTASYQQYWLIAGLKELECDGVVEQHEYNKVKPWNLTENAQNELNKYFETNPVINDVLQFRTMGAEIREDVKNLLYQYICNEKLCSKYSYGMRQADIFRNCGLDWGDYKSAESTRQQFWIIAALHTLCKEGLITRDQRSKRWKCI